MQPPSEKIEVGFASAVRLIAPSCTKSGARTPVAIGRYVNWRADSTSRNRDLRTSAADKELRQAATTVLSANVRGLADNDQHRVRPLLARSPRGTNICFRQ